MNHCDTILITWPRVHQARGIRIAIALAALLVLGCSKTDNQHQRLEGLVFHDSDGNAARNGREKGLARVVVSNGRDVVLTDVRGRWFLPPNGPRAPFVVAPRGWHQTASAESNLVALQPWHASTTPTVHIGKMRDDAPPPDATIGFSTAEAPMPQSDTSNALPTAFNVGDLHVIVVDDRIESDDNTAFVEADLLHAGAARPVLMLLATGRDDVVQLLGERPSIVIVSRPNDMAIAVGLDAQGDLVRFGASAPDKVTP